jgi:hypothetical protein
MLYIGNVCVTQCKDPKEEVRRHSLGGLVVETTTPIVLCVIGAINSQGNRGGRLPLDPRTKRLSIIMTARHST